MRSRNENLYETCRINRLLRWWCQGSEIKITLVSNNFSSSVANKIWIFHYKSIKQVCHKKMMLINVDLSHLKFQVIIFIPVTRRFVHAWYIKWFFSFISYAYMWPQFYHIPQYFHTYSKTLRFRMNFEELLRLYTSISLQFVLDNPQTVVVSKGLGGINIITREH